MTVGLSNDTSRLAPSDTQWMISRNVTWCILYVGFQYNKKRPHPFHRRSSAAYLPGQMWDVHHCLSYLLGRRRAFSEAYRFSRRAFEIAAAKNLTRAASHHAMIAQALARYSEAEEVRIWEIVVNHLPLFRQREAPAMFSMRAANDHRRLPHCLTSWPQVLRYALSKLGQTDGTKDEEGASIMVHKHSKLEQKGWSSHWSRLGETSTSGGLRPERCQALD